MCRPGSPTAFCVTPLWAVLPPAKYRAGPEARVFSIAQAYPAPTALLASPHGWASQSSVPQSSRAELGLPTGPLLPCGVKCGGVTCLWVCPR